MRKMKIQDISFPTKKTDRKKSHRKDSTQKVITLLGRIRAY